MFEVSLADLQNDEVAFRKFKLITEDVQGKNCLTNFHGMDLTRDKMCSMVKKWQVNTIFKYWIKWSKHLALDAAGNCFGGIFHCTNQYTRATVEVLSSENGQRIFRICSHISCCRQCSSISSCFIFDETSDGVCWPSCSVSLPSFLACVSFPLLHAELKN